ncbi:hypothetical protein DINM_003102 [Dirofilaria immitis]|nr:hypothetical protein [Dirofilaria immitis]
MCAAMLTVPFVVSSLTPNGVSGEWYYSLGETRISDFLCPAFNISGYIVALAYSMQNGFYEIVLSMISKKSSIFHVPTNTLFLIVRIVTGFPAYVEEKDPESTTSVLLTRRLHIHTGPKNRLSLPKKFLFDHRAQNAECQQHKLPQKTELRFEFGGSCIWWKRVICGRIRDL